ncbi:HNH endonuclease [Maritalea porphyrae]|uniref:HNH endonuclease n=1 Tax=Maritalea porphyrae TaxID=880732 RepID=UPI0022AF5FAA|nr:HNH endonuclease signature motif containing protein [Maritalea porphyrae]MCZ4270916.1 HNH endonuclease signature motif containing protein [Maritalea porphyrae]
MPKVTIESVLWFSGNNGIVLDAKEVLHWLVNGRMIDLIDAIEMAEKYKSHHLMREADCGQGSGILSSFEEMSFDEFLGVITEYNRHEFQDDLNQKAKYEACKARRSEFAKSRPELVLALLNRGDDFVCAKQGCETTSDIAVDHITPLSRGGTDDLGNLQFLCRYHNSVKSDKIERGDQ